MEALGLNEGLCRACRSLKILTPTEIQKSTIKPALLGQDIIGIAKTGSGKTACYCLPTLQRLSKDPYGVFALVLLPTKELAAQVYEQFCAFARPLGLQSKVTLIVGGAGWLGQSKALADRPYVVIGTPGRILHLLEQSEVLSAFSNLAVNILDEADRLLAGTIHVETGKILSLLRPKPSVARQYLLFTATSSPSVEKCGRFIAEQKFALANRKPLPVVPIFGDSVEEEPPEASDHALECLHLPSKYVPLLVNTNPEGSTVESLQQFYIFVPTHVKYAYLLHFLQTIFSDLAGIIFVKTCQTCQLITTFLEQYEFQVTTLHSLLDHRRRVAHLAKFRSGQSTLLVATDVASRGLDIPKVDFVINFDFPTAYEDYIHRAGRTARVGRKGIALSIVCDKDNIQLVHEVESRIGSSLTKHDVNEDDVLKLLTGVVKKQQEARSILMEAGFFEHAVSVKKRKLRARGGLQAIIKKRKIRGRLSARSRLKE